MEFGRYPLTASVRPSSPPPMYSLYRVSRSAMASFASSSDDTLRSSSASMNWKPPFAYSSNIPSAAE